MSGHYNPLTLSLGALSITITAWASIKIGVVDNEGHPLELLARSPRYALWLLIEIVQANIAVVRQIFDRQLPAPGIQHFDTTGLDDLGRVIYANSVTLTPGTITIDITGDCLVVHALNKQSLADMEDGNMYFQVAKLMGGKRQDSDHSPTARELPGRRHDQ